MSSGVSVPRAPISATYSSPGPMYDLPTLIGREKHDPRSRHSRGPAFAFGTRAEESMTNSSPGPMYKPDSKIIRTGKEEAPRATLAGRHRDIGAFATPGPTLFLESDPQGNGPSYSFGSRQKFKPTSDAPGPNAYKLPSTVGKTVESNVRQAPSVAVKSRHKSDDIDIGPGPGAYKLPDAKNYSKAPPKYSLKGRTEPPADNTHKPGPGSHSPEKVVMNKKEAPRYSFGTKHSPYVVSLIVPVGY